MSDPFVLIAKKKPSKILCFPMVYKISSMRRKGLEPSQEKLPLEPESSASAIPPSPLTNDIIPYILSFGKYFFEIYQ